jgi:EAL and modified HD-GYP domain-containing signal transduction protein
MTNDDPCDTSSRDHFYCVARQPILDRAQAVIGYELLFRAGLLHQAYSHLDGDAASRDIILKALSVFGIDPLTGGGERRAFINFSRGVLLEDLVELLPPSRVVVEVQETVEPDDEVVAACRRLKDAGYTLALDNFTYDLRYEPLIALSDIIKVNFRDPDRGVRRRLAERLAPRGVRLLADKVESWDDYREAVGLGYSLFQGYFFCRPETLSRRSVSPSRLGYLRLLEELGREDVSLDTVELLIKHEPALTLHLLVYINSALFGCRTHVNSIRHAALMLGVENLKRWVLLVAVLGLYEGRPPELFVTCIVRARFLEVLGERIAPVSQRFDMFLLGVLSAADALVRRPLPEALSQFAVSGDLREALLNGSGTFGQALGLLKAYERGNWPEVTARADVLGVAEPEIAAIYYQALQWANDALTLLTPREEKRPCASEQHAASL